MNNLIIGVIALFGIVVVVGIILVIIANNRPENAADDLLQERLAEIVEQGETMSLEEIEMSQPLTERIIFPLARKIGEIAMRFTPQNVLENTKIKIEHAGMGGSIEPTVFLAARFFLSIFLGGFFIFLFSVSKGSMSLMLRFVIIAAGFLLGFFLPNMLLQAKIDRRQKNILHALPDALDLLTICVEAGLGFDAAMNKVADKWQTDLSLEFARVSREVQLGKSRREALRSMADRLGVNDLSSFVAAVIQTEQLGVSLAKVLRIQADQMRMKRRQRAEQEAHKAPLKMLIPMTLLIFPSIVIVLVAPAGFQLLNSALMDVF